MPLSALFKAVMNNRIPYLDGIMTRVPKEIAMNIQVITTAANRQKLRIYRQQVM